MKKTFLPTTFCKNFISDILKTTAFKNQGINFFFIFIGLLIFDFSATAQVDTNSLWTWLSGDNIANQAGVYGTRGIASQGNKPGARDDAFSWRDTAGNLWLMGGTGSATVGYGLLNDLWKYEPVINKWTWMKGDTVNDDAFANYGVKGVASVNNQPGGRYTGVSWTDKAGKFWLMGGFGVNSNQFGQLNDLWKFDPSQNEWTWVNGDSTTNENGVYGIMGTAATENKPGARLNAVSWTDLDGKLWLMGGIGHDASGPGYLNDLWKFDPDKNEWTWINGDKTAYQKSVYGARGIPAPGNKPGAREGAISWVSHDGKFWLMGGEGISSSGFGALNDLWKYDPVTNEWAWINGDSTILQYGVYGTKGTPDAGNKPGARWNSVSWTSQDDRLWLMGGWGNAATGYGKLNDLWQYDPVNNEWTWINGDNEVDQFCNYGFPGITSSENKPGGRHRSTNWIDKQGNLWLIGGQGFDATNDYFGYAFLNDLWKYDPVNNTWTWMNGDNKISQLGVYGTQGVTSYGNYPGARWGSVTWTDKKNMLWLFGGEGFTPNGFGWLNDLWKYNPATNEWTWMKGDNTVYELGIYGNQGIAAVNNNPGGRHFAGSWIDTLGKLWMIGGYGFDINDLGYFNDLWKYDPETNLWTWMKGDTLVNQPGMYGTRGIPSLLNNPRGREHVVCWTGSDGKLWMMGGYSFSSSHLNDLWNYNTVTNEWTWINGDNTTNNTGIYGTMGIASPENKPGGRWGASGWQDNEGLFWLIGGQGYGVSEFGYLNDLWKYNPATNEWTWEKGDKTVNQPGLYGTKGIASSDSKPGGRTGAVSWKDRDGRLWMMNGNGYASSVFGSLNDLWKFDPVTREWTWIKGDNITNQPGIYGTKGIAAISNKPGAREQAVNWSTEDGSFWLFGGNATISPGIENRLNDLWKLTPTENTYYKDADGDGYGNADVSMKANYVPAGYVLKTSDCNDNNAAVHPGAEEICDGLDNNCDGRVDEGCPPVSKTKVFVKDIIVIEGNEGYRNAIFPVWLNGKSTTPVTIKYQTVDSSATSPDDYKSTSGTICFSPNSLFQVVTVKVRGDRTMEPNEKFQLLLYAPVNAVLPDSSATCTIINDDKRPSVQIHDATATEKSGLALVKVTMKEECGQEVRVKYYTKEKSARSPEDYIGIFNGELIFYPGEKEKFIKVTIVKDNLKEKTEEFEVRLKDDEHFRDGQGREEHDKDSRDVAEVKIINSPSNDYGHPGASGKYFSTPELPSELQVRVLPNPSQNSFQVNLASNGKGAIQLRVSDMQGRVVENRKLEGMMQQISLGERWSHGNYILQVIQGDEMKSVQLIKLK